jgi:hypothetical protein
MEKKHRSPGYPQMSLSEAIEKIGLLHSAIGSHPTSREVVAKGLGYSGISGASATAIAALTRYGLIEGRGDDVRVSDLAMAILHPHSDEERQNALRTSALNPDLFRELSEKFPGRTPNNELLKNYLVRNKFTAASADAAVLAYKETIEFVGGFGGGYDSAPSSDKQEPPPMQQTATPSATSRTLSEPTGDLLLGRWDFTDGGRLQIFVSPEVDTEEALDMAQTLIELRRKELQRKKRSSGTD